MEDLEYKAVKEYIDKLLELVKEVLYDKRLFPNLEFAVVFGSAVRPQDFVIGASDMDVLAALSGEPSRRRVEMHLYHTEVVINLMSINEVHNLFDIGHPLAFMIYRDSKAIIDNGLYSELIAKRKPKITDFTLKALRRSIFAALELGIEMHQLEEYRRAVTHAYHSVKHLARYKAASRQLPIESYPISDREVEEILAEEPKRMFREIADLRRKMPARDESIRALDNARMAASIELNCEIPSLYRLEELMKRGYFLSLIEMRDMGNRIAITCRVMREEGVEHVEIA